MGDGELVWLARTGDAAAFRLLVERHRAMALARAARLGAGPGDADDIVQESFLQAFTALGRLRDPDRFGAWLGGIVVNVHRAAARRPAVVLLGEWPEDLHPASADGVPSAEELDRAEAVRAAVARLPAGQRRAVELYYYADVPAAQIAASPGAAKASLHKARRRLREHITANRPDLVPVLSRRTPMTTVRIAAVQPHVDTRLDGTTVIGHVLVVLADDPGQRAMGLWLRSRQGMPLWRVVRAGSGEPPRPPHGPQAGGLVVREFTPEDLAVRLLGAAGGAVTGVDIDELGPAVLAAQVAVTSPAGTQQVTADPGSALALAAGLAVPVRVADALMDRLAVPVTGDDLLGPFTRRTPARPGGPRFEPVNLTFASGLDGWTIGGDSRCEVTGSHWDDYTVTAEDGAAILSAAVPHPYGSVFVGQEFLASNYLGSTLTVRGEIRAQDVTDHAVLSLRVVCKAEEHGERHDSPAAPGPIRGPVLERLPPGLPGPIITGSHDWTSYEVAAPVPARAYQVEFDLTFTGPGQVALRNVTLTRAPGQAAGSAPGQS
jgi:RNA polymerase sigma-70 factor, ECF subfamily